MAAKSSAVHQAVVEIRAKAKELREAFGAEGPACALEWAANTVETGLRADSDRVVYLPEAATITGYHPGSLARLVRKGQIRDQRLPGSRGRIKVRVGDLPTKAGHRHTLHADVRDLASRLGIEARRA